jgi:hypothetical protein
LAEEVLVIEEQFLEGGPCDVGEVEFGLRAGGAHPVALGDVLASGAGGLDHLVVGPGASVEVGITEADGAVVDEGGDLEGAEGAVAAAGSQLARVHGWGWVVDRTDRTDRTDRSDLFRVGGRVGEGGVEANGEACPGWAKFRLGSWAVGRTVTVFPP